MSIAAAPVPLMGSAPFRKQRPPQKLRRDVDRHHHRDDEDQDRADVGIVELANRLPMTPTNRPVSIFSDTLSTAVFEPKRRDRPSMDSMAEPFSRRT
jgi:hypothetical protein